MTRMWRVWFRCSINPTGWARKNSWIVIFKTVYYKKYSFERCAMLADEIKAGESVNIEFKREVLKMSENI